MQIRALPKAVIAVIAVSLLPIKDLVYIYVGRICCIFFFQTGLNTHMAPFIMILDSFTIVL